MSTFVENQHPRQATGRFATKAHTEPDVAIAPRSLALVSTGVEIRDRESGASFGVHEECLRALQDLSPQAWDPMEGGTYVTIGPVFGEFSCAYKACQQA